MSIGVYNGLDLNKTEIKNAKIHVLSSAPSSPQEGQVYYNSTTKTVEFYSGSAWIILGRLDQVTAPTASVNLNSQKITSLGTPTTGTDAATKAYVDGLASGISWKAAVRVASTGNVSVATGLENGDVIDGVTLATGDRVLLKNQSSATQNGIYVVVASGAGVRAGDADADPEISGGSAVWVNEGTTNADTGWVCTTNDPIILNVTSLTFVQFTGGATRASLGLATTDSPEFLALNIGHASDTTLARVSAGVLSVEGNTIYAAGGTDVPVADGGTGSSTAAGARTNLGAVGKYTALIGDGSTTTITITQATHGLMSNGQMIAMCYDASTGAMVLPDIQINPGTGAVSFIFATAPASNAYRINIVG